MFRIFPIYGKYTVNIRPVYFPLYRKWKVGHLLNFCSRVVLLRRKYTDDICSIDRPYISGIFPVYALFPLPSKWEDGIRLLEVYRK